MQDLFHFGAFVGRKCGSPSARNLAAIAPKENAPARHRHFGRHDKQAPFHFDEKWRGPQRCGITRLLGGKKKAEMRMDNTNCHIAQARETSRDLSLLQKSLGTGKRGSFRCDQAPAKKP